jgi:hypothetical protein
MNINTLGIPLTFVILVAVILWFIIWGKGHWLLKAVVVAVSLYFGIATWQSLNGLLGWPAPESESLPDKFAVHWVVIKEPSKKTADPGAIFIWVSGPVKESLFAPDFKEPRAYKLPYSKEMHQRAEGALSLIRKGEKVIGMRGKGKGKGWGQKGKGKGEGEGEKGAWGMSRKHIPDIVFHKLPPPKFPPKMTPKVKNRTI